MSELTAAERQTLADYLPFPVRHDDWAVLMCGFERILAARLAEQREQIAVLIDEADACHTDLYICPGCEAARIVREWGAR